MLYDYFQSTADYFWQWEEDQEVIAIPGGGTIVYRAYVLQILEKLAPQGLPPFGSLLLALIATNPDADQNLKKVYSIVSTVLQTTDENTVTLAMNFLKLLADVPLTYRTGTKRLLLLQTLFQGCHQISSVKKARQTLESYRQNQYGAGVVSNKKPFNRALITLDFQPVALLQNKFPDAESIIAEIAGLPEIPPEALELEKSSLADAGATLVDELVNNYKTFTTGALIKWLWGGLNIPFHSVLPSQQPLGGVSDLTNKGDFDRLLISEYANDDLVFLSRLANNEALYLNRETPPAHNNLQRIILLDATLKNWGTPKTLAFAVMLAIAKHPKTDIPCTAFALGENYQEIGLNSLDEIIDGLQILEGSLHTAQGLTKFFNEFGSFQNKEIIFISSADALKPAAMQLTLSEYQAYFAYQIETSAAGQIDTYKIQSKGKKHLQTIQLPLEELWKDKSKIVQQERKGKSIVSETKEGKFVSYPILTNLSAKVRKIFVTTDGEIFVITTDKCLFRIYNNIARQHGYNPQKWELIYEQLPYHETVAEIGILENGQYVLLIFNRRKLHLTLLNLTTGEQKRNLFQDWEVSDYPDFMFHENHFYYLTANEYWRINLSGEIKRFHAAQNTLLQEYQKRQSILKHNNTTHYFSNHALRNVQNIYINNNSQLVINSHVLQNGIPNDIRFNYLKDTNKTIEAIRQFKKIFIFPDGSQIKILTSNIALMKSSNENIPDIYIPLYPYVGIGIATDKVFTGYEVHLKETTFDIYLQSIGNDKTELSQLLHYRLVSLPMEHVQQLLTNLPGILFRNIGRKRAYELRDALQEKKCTVLLKTAKELKELEIITPSEFFRNYIDPFIAHIVKHGTGS